MNEEEEEAGENERGGGAGGRKAQVEEEEVCRLLEIHEPWNEKTFGFSTFRFGVTFPPVPLIKEETRDKFAANNGRYLRVAELRLLRISPISSSSSSRWTRMAGFKWIPFYLSFDLHSFRRSHVSEFEEQIVFILVLAFIYVKNIYNYTIYTITTFIQNSIDFLLFFSFFLP